MARGVAFSDGRRRISAKNRARLLEAASELFAQRGYRGTTTRDIAAAAGITERTLFRQVGSKAALFREAVIGPVDAFVQQLALDWGGRPRGSREVEVEVREFYQKLLIVIEGERNLLLALLAALAHPDQEADFPDLQMTFAPMLEALTEIFGAEADARGWTLDHRITVRLVIGMALSATMHQDWLFAGGMPPDLEVLVDQLTRFTVWGVAGGPVR